MDLSKFNEEQRQVVLHREGSLLVSAAAGSGKTTTLVSHILNRLSDADDPADLRRMIVVTFTNAAAAEMRGRLTQELVRLAEASPDNAHLRHQAGIVQQARISTVDSLCSYLVRNYFQKLDISPDIRIAGDAEEQLLRSDVLDELMHEVYEDLSPDMLALLDGYTGEKNDTRLRDLILTLFDSSQNAPFPEKWLAEVTPCFPENTEDLARSVPVREAEAELDLLLNVGIQLSEKLIEVCNITHEKLLAILDQDEKMLRGILECSDYDERRRLLMTMKPAVLRRTKDMDPAVAEEIRLLRGSLSAGKGYLGAIGEYRERYGAELSEELHALKLTEGPLRALISLTRRFTELRREAMREKNIASFMDIEHMALELLWEKDAETPRTTPLAEEIRRQYDEIVIDEYQDINKVQDMILEALSGEEAGSPNLFMVGDVKQSIYRFRRAKPEIFMEKYGAFAETAGAPHRKLDLGRNYRSRAEILAGINSLFRPVMSGIMGGTDYDGRAALYPGASYPGTGKKPELLLVPGRSGSEENTRAEAEAIALKIRELTETQQVYELKTGVSRPLRLRDIVILLRSTERAGIMTEVLERCGIAAVSEDKHGFFETQEVQFILDLLKIIDNPLQDIPLAAVLLSPLGGFDETELGKTLSAAGEAENGPDTGLWGTLKRAAQCQPESCGRALRFLERLEGWRQDAGTLTIPELIHKLLSDTGYELYLRAMPGGSVRMANVEMLLSQAADFEATSYHGLYQFNRYIERQKALKVDSGEAAVLSPDREAVRILTIHGSKGLEYPVVFLAEANRVFNLKDTAATCLITDGGIALRTRDPLTRENSGNLLWQNLAGKMRSEEVSEELRVLYVALTRAKERLIVTGCVKEPGSFGDDWREARYYEDKLSPAVSGRARCYLDWLAMVRVSGRLDFTCGIADAPAETLKKEQGMHYLALQQRLEALKAEEPAEAENAAQRTLEGRIRYRYPYEAIQGIRDIYSVSALSEEAAAAEERGEAFPEEDRDDRSARPYRKTERRSAALSGAETGTAYHKIMEHLPIEAGEHEDALRSWMAEKTASGLLTEEEAAAVDPADICAFFRAPLGERVRKAAHRGVLHREQPFIMGLPLSAVKPETELSETVLVQGIIDLYFEEEDGLVLVDYKTDRVKQESVLKERYRTQLDYYRKALEQAAGKKVRESYLYSFALRRFIPMD